MLLFSIIDRSVVKQWMIDIHSESAAESRMCTGSEAIE